jgi:hypothetical protein
MREFLAEYDYNPSLNLGVAAGELYDDVGEIAMALIKAKIRRVRALL